VKSRRLFKHFRIGLTIGALAFTSVLGCEPPEEMMAEDWANDGESSGDDWVETDYEAQEYIGAKKADSGWTRTSPSQENAKSVRAIRDGQRPLIGTEAIGHGTPQPWKPSDNTPEASEDDN
jgi:hypothetical protein